MNKLAPLFAATVLALSGGVLAETGGNDDSQSPGDSQATPEAKKPEGFLLLQRNIYVPVDAEGKMASKQWVVIDKQGFITADELEAAAREGGNGSENGGMKDDEQGSNEQATPKAQEPSVSPAMPASPTGNEHLPLGKGPTIAS